MTSLTGCGHFAAPDSPTVQIPRNCEDLAETVPHPEPSKAVDPKVTVGEYSIALDEANGNLKDTRTCQANQRKRFAKGA